MISMTDLKPGRKIELEGEIFIVTHYAHTNPGKGQAFVKAKIKNMKTGQVLERTFKKGDAIKTPDFQEKEMQYLYKDDSGFHFMDNENYEQTFLTEEQMGDNWKYIQESVVVKMLFHNDAMIGINLPPHMVLEITQTEPGLKGDTTGTASKPATIETGAVIQVPLFITTGEKIKIDTRTGDYIERAK